MTVLSQAVLLQAHYSSRSNQPGLPLFSCFTAPSSSEAYPTRLEQLLKYQLGIWGTPKDFQLHRKSYQL